jgi:hypothetical protein
MARIIDLVTLAKTSVDSNDYFVISNTAGTTSKKINVSSIFASLVTAGTGGEDIWSSITNKNQLNFKGIKSGDTDLLTVTTVSDNIVLTALEAGIDLSLCNNATSAFLSGMDFKSTISGQCPVTNGGTGLSTIAKGAMLYASAADTIAATAAMSTHGQLLIGNATTGIPTLNTLTGGTNITVTNTAGSISIAASLSTMASDLDMANYDIDLGTGWLSGNGTHEGININTDGKVFIGEDTPTAAFVSALNIKGSIEFTNTDAPTIKPTATTSSTVGQPLTLASGSSASGAAGNLNLTAGTASGNAAGGDIILTAGRDTSGSSDGDIQLKTYAGSSATAGLTVATQADSPAAVDVTVNTGNLVITTALKGIVHTGSGTVTQATDHTTGVTINATSGVITLAAVALAATTNAEFTFTNSAIQADSVILLTMQDANTTNNAQLACALVSLTGGSCVISIVNPHSSGATSVTASKIHFLVINNS